MDTNHVSEVEKLAKTLRATGVTHSQSEATRMAEDMLATSKKVSDDFKQRDAKINPPKDSSPEVENAQKLMEEISASLAKGEGRIKADRIPAQPTRPVMPAKESTVFEEPEIRAPTQPDKSVEEFLTPSEPEPPAKQVVVEEPVVEEPVVVEEVAEEPVVEEAVVEEPAVEEVAEEPVAEEPVVDEAPGIPIDDSLANITTAEAAEEVVEEEPAAEVAEEPVEEEMAVEEPVVEEEPAAEVVEEVAEEPVVEEAVEEEPAAEVVEEPAAEVVEEPVAEEVAEEPVVEEAVEEEPVAEEAPVVEEDAPAEEPVANEEPAAETTVEETTDDAPSEEQSDNDFSVKEL